ncbi:sulfotransferase [Asticcacaulis sp.]|uniref:sulfotransferase family protein n=1 Tax=Asticcacaulis sp. TaxID=1872648 RepID=UPI003F7CC99A
MTYLTQTPLVLQALEALKAMNRYKAVSLLRQDMAEAPESGERWRSVANLAETIGEKGIQLEAMRRLAQTQPQTLDNLLAYAQVLSRYGQSEISLQIINTLPGEVQAHPQVQHFLGMIASEHGEFDKAEKHFRRALVKAPMVAQTWHALAAIKTFQPDDADILLLEAARGEMNNKPPEVKSTFLYALGKAYHDAGDATKAWEAYNAGASAMRDAQSYDIGFWQSAAYKIRQDFTVENMTRLRPSQCNGQHLIFVNGLPRSGTTLVEQILASHSEVISGGETNLSNSLFRQNGDFSFSSAISYQTQANLADPWGELAQAYLNILTEQFGTGKRIVDKSLNQSRFLGLLMHSFPQARMIWLRRKPEDNALSIFRTHFRQTLPWSWSLSDIAEYMRVEDALYAHWTALFSDRILTVPYEQLVSEPDVWARRILAHVDLAEEPQVFTPHMRSGSVMTASVAQVRAPITTDRIGGAEAYGDAVSLFREVYYR